MNRPQYPNGKIRRMNELACSHPVIFTIVLMSKMEQIPRSENPDYCRQAHRFTSG
jgi:hypothetical protein